MTKNELIKIIDECDKQIKNAPPNPVIITTIRSKQAYAIKQLINIIRSEINE